MAGFAKNTLLIVDDEKTNLLYLNDLLSPYYTIYTAKNGLEGIQRAGAYLPDLILLDIVMPEMDGYGVITKLKESEKTRSIPVIFITGLISTEDEKKGLAFGAEDYISKPFSDMIVKLRVRNQIKIVNQMRTLDKRLRQQALMTSITQNFLSYISLSALFTKTLRMVGEFMEAAQVLLFMLDDDGKILTCQNEWINPELKLDTRVGNKMPLGKALRDVAYDLELKGKELCLHSNDPSFREVMVPYRADSHKYITTPIFIRGRLRALIDYSVTDDGLKWERSDIDLALLAASVFSGFFERDAMERQSSIVEHSPDINLYISADGAVQYANPSAAEMTGYTQAEFAAGGLGVIFDEQTLDGILHRYIPRVTMEETAALEAQITRRDGQTRTLIINIFPTAGYDFGVIMRDVTDTRRLEADLIASKELAEQGSRAKSEFLSRMSHAMQAPIDVIINMHKSAQNADNPLKRNGFLMKADQASRGLLRLIDDVLDIADMESGTFQLERAEINFMGMLQKIFDKTLEYTREKSQLFSTAVDPSIPETLISDEKRLTQIIENLLSNASKFTPEQGLIQFKAFAVNVENDILTIQIEVTDNGIGIPPAKHEAVFAHFEQIGGSAAIKYSGSGLGLPLARNIVERMDGKMWVDSAPDEGSKFTFTFKAQMESRGAKAAAPMSFTGKTALLVEDVEINSEIVTVMLEETGIEIICASNGREAFKAFSADPWKFNVILMDINMPEMDGVEATKRIRAIGPEGKRVPIIAMTANVMPEDVKHYLASGMSDHIGKPLDTEELLRKISIHMR